MLLTNIYLLHLINVKHACIVHLFVILKFLVSTCRPIPESTDPSTRSNGGYFPFKYKKFLKVIFSNTLNPTIGPAFENYFKSPGEGESPPAPPRKPFVSIVAYPKFISIFIYYNHVR